MVDDVIIRPLTADDSLVELTALLHRAYARLAAMGLNFTATDQSVELTARRIHDGHCIVAVEARSGEDRIVGTVSVCRPCERTREAWTEEPEAYYEPSTAHFQQLAVDPAAQGRRLGDRLVAACEQWALAHGYRQMVLDTAAPATHLRTRYERLGYRVIDEVQRAGKTYRSVVMRKVLEIPA